MKHEALSHADFVERGAESVCAQVASQGEVAKLMTEGGLKSNGYNLSIGLKSSPIGSAI